MKGDRAQASTLSRAAALAFWAITGCMPMANSARFGVPERVIPDMGDACGASGLRLHIGHDLASLAEARLPGDLRALRPGQEVTRELSPKRLNVQLDDRGRILRLYCG